MNGAEQTALVYIKNTYEAFCNSLNEVPHQAILDCFSSKSLAPGLELKLSACGINERNLYPILKTL